VPLPCRPLLMPGVADSRTLADATDFRVKQTQQSGLSFNGSNGRGNSVTVDGGEANDPAGGVRLTLSQDAIQEFQINRSNYSAELGPPAVRTSTLFPDQAPTNSTAQPMHSFATTLWMRGTHLHSDLH
jgi:hypothetical protein